MSTRREPHVDATQAQALWTVVIPTGGKKSKSFFVINARINPFLKTVHVMFEGDRPDRPLFTIADLPFKN